MIDFTEDIEREIYQAISKDEGLIAHYVVDDYEDRPFIEIGRISIAQEPFPKVQWYTIIANVHIEDNGDNAKQSVNEISKKVVKLLGESYATDWSGMMIHRHSYRIDRDKFIGEDGRWIFEKDIFIELLIEKDLSYAYSPTR